MANSLYIVEKEKNASEIFRCAILIFLFLLVVRSTGVKKSEVCRTLPAFSRRSLMAIVKRDNKLSSLRQHREWSAYPFKSTTHNVTSIEYANTEASSPRSMASKFYFVCKVVLN